MTATCARCGLGSVQGIDSSLTKAEVKRDGFRPNVVWVHRKAIVCTLANNARGKELAARQAAEARANVWWRRALRWLKRVFLLPRRLVKE